MADDTLDDLDEDMEDILGDASLDDFDPDDDDPDQGAADEDLTDDDADDPDGEKTSENKILSRLKEKIPAKLRTKKAMIILGAACLLFILLTAGLIFIVFGGEEEPDQIPPVDQAGIESGTIQEQEIIFEDIVELAPFERISLKTSSTMGLISLTLALELTDYRYRKQIYAMEVRLRQIVETQVAEMTWLELRNPEGKIRLKYDLINRMNSLFPKTTVRNIYFTYFIMQ